MKKIVIIPCGGMGTRLGQDIPKCLVTIGGRTLLDYQMELLESFDEIRVIVGYRASDVYKQAPKASKRIKFIDNVAFATTNNAFAIYLASQDIPHRFVIMDGDLFVDKGSFDDFLKATQEDEDLFCITATKTEHPILVTTDDRNRITGFTDAADAPYEWCGVAWLDNTKFSEDGNFNFRGYRPFPLRSYVLECCEIDTAADLEVAKKSLPSFGYRKQAQMNYG